MTMVDCAIWKVSTLRARLYLAALLAACSVGCSDNPLASARFYPVKGKVLLADGKPLTSGQIGFVGTKLSLTATANIESDGGFTFKGTSHDGLPEGEYKVRIDIPEVAAGKGAAGKVKLPFARKYGDEDTSDLKATVTSDESKNNFEFKLAAKDEVAPGRSRGDR
jgi:hypothetical protein